MQNVLIDPLFVNPDGEKTMDFLEVRPETLCDSCQIPIGNDSVRWIVPDHVAVDFFIHPECEEDFMRTARSLNWT